jgi:hypothetical protein
MLRATIRLLANKPPYKVIVEPWAQEFTVREDADCFLVALHPDKPPGLAAELANGALVLTICEGGSTYEFWRGEVCEFTTSIAIPGESRNDANRSESPL